MSNALNPHGNTTRRVPIGMADPSKYPNYPTAAEIASKRTPNPQQFKDRAVLNDIPIGMADPNKYPDYPTAAEMQALFRR